MRLRGISRARHVIAPYPLRYEPHLHDRREERTLKALHLQLNRMLLAAKTAATRLEICGLDTLKLLL
jgi:hypothetical protein